MLLSFASGQLLSGQIRIALCAWILGGGLLNTAYWAKY
jgi:hypothetical protein